MKEFFNNHRKLLVWLFVILYPFALCVARSFFLTDCASYEFDGIAVAVIWLAALFLPGCAAFFWLSVGEKGDRFLLAVVLSLPYLIVMVPAVWLFQTGMDWGSGMAAQCGWVLP